MQDEYGLINNVTFSPKTLASNIYRLPGIHGDYNCSAGLCKPELIFHDSIPLELLRMVLVWTPEQKRIVEELLNYQVPVLLRTAQLGEALSQTQFIDGQEYLVNTSPQYCYTGSMGLDYGEELSPDYVMGFDSTLNPYTLNDHPELPQEIRNQENAYIWQKRLDYCGIDEEYSPEKEEELLKKIEDRMQEIYFEDAPRIPVTEYPPWRYTPEYYQKEIAPYSQ